MRVSDERTAYNPRTYWRARSERQGASYVGPLGDPKATEAQVHEFAKPLRDALREVSHVGRLLDFGSGVGRFAELMADEADSYVGVDLNPHGIELASQLFGLEFTHLEHDALPFADDSIDTLVSVTVIQHVPDDDWATTWAPELRRVLSPQGCAVIIDDRGGTAAHMFPREPEAVAADLGLGVRSLVSLPSNHWLGIFA